jgi:hypothetical protein
MIPNIKIKLPRFSMLLMLGVLFYGCEKLEMLSKKPPTKSKGSCQILSMTGYDGFTAHFTYTPWGDPDVIDVTPNGTGMPDFYFKYDQNHRLIEYQAFMIKDSVFWELRRFYYEGNRIVKDSFFAQAHIETMYVEQPPLSVGNYVYDSYGRIIEYNWFDTNEETHDTTHYTYPAENPFVDNRNYLAGNPILMFVAKDYSKTTPAEAYNKQGYPT